MPGNYRPGSLTSVVCKTMEKIVRDHLTSHMRQTDLFSKKQFGFITGRSTTLQLLEVLDKLTQEVDSGGKVDCICKYGLPESVWHSATQENDQQTKMLWNRRPHTLMDWKLPIG